jgi:hypothetical protein
MMQLGAISTVFCNSEHLLTSLTDLVFILISYQFKSPCMLCPRGMIDCEEKNVLWNFKRGYLILT